MNFLTHQHRGVIALYFILKLCIINLLWVTRICFSTLKCENKVLSWIQLYKEETGSKFKSNFTSDWCWGMESACSPRVCAGFLWLLWFLPLPKNMHVSFICDSKLILGVSVTVIGRLSLCGPGMDWQPVQSVPCISPNESWDRLQPPLHNPELDWV